jgi:hypothetical protein
MKTLNPAKSLKPKKCKSCGEKFEPSKPLQQACGWQCAIVIAGEKRTKADNKRKNVVKRELREQKEKLKSRSDWMKEAQHAFNKYIRERDYGLPCISCGKPTKIGDHAGHWKPTSSSPELRFNEDNCHLQCVQCNLYFHGNVEQYRVGLLKRIGESRVISLTVWDKAKKYTVQELKELIEEYKLKTKLLKENRKNG